MRFYTLLMSKMQQLLLILKKGLAKRDFTKLQCLVFDILFLWFSSISSSINTYLIMDLTNAVSILKIQHVEKGIGPVHKTKQQVFYKCKMIHQSHKDRRNFKGSWKFYLCLYKSHSHLFIQFIDFLWWL